MQAAKKAVETIKETAANIGASAKSGLEKTKATVQEKSERMSARDPMQKEMATEKKEERINHAEMGKQEAREHNAATKMSANAGHVTGGQQYTASGPATETAAAGYSTSGTYGSGQQLATDHNMSTMPAHGHGIGYGLGREKDMLGSHPIETNTGMDTTAAHNIHAGETVPGSGPHHY